MRISKLYSKFDKAKALQRERLSSLTREAKAMKASMIKANIDKAEAERRLGMRDNAAMVVAYLARAAQCGESFELEGRQESSADYMFRLRKGSKEGYVSVASQYLRRDESRCFDVAIESMIRAVREFQNYESNPWALR
jgi:hypothetical protein